MNNQLIMIININIYLILFSLHIAKSINFIISISHIYGHICTTHTKEVDQQHK